MGHNNSHMTKAPLGNLAGRKIFSTLISNNPLGNFLSFPFQSETVSLQGTNPMPPAHKSSWFT